MASYAVHTRIEGVRPTRQRSTVTRGGTPCSIEEDRVPVELVGRSPGEVLAERWMRIREAWSQTTFFLFDPDSWR